MMMHIYKPSTQEAKARGPQIPGQPQLQIKTWSKKKKEKGSKA